MGGAEVEAVFILPVGSRMRGIQTIGAGPSAAHLPSAGAGGGGRGEGEEGVDTRLYAYAGSRRTACA